MLYNIPCRSNPMPYYKYVNPQIDYYSMPLTFQNTGTGNISFQFQNQNDTAHMSIQYSKNGGAWSNLGYFNSITLYPNDVVQMSGINSRIATGSDNYSQYFSMNGSVGLKIYGNINSIVSDSPGNFGTGRYCYYGMFRNCTQIVDAYNLKLPSPECDNRAFIYFMAGCTNLSAGPATLDMTTMNNTNSLACHMFDGCSKLVKATRLCPSGIYDNAWTQAFYNCTSLKVGPLMDGTTLLGGPNTHLLYTSMFYNCRSLSALEVKISAWQGGGLDNWMNGVPNNTSCLFIKPLALPVNRSYIPSQWTVLNRIGNNLFYAEQGDGTNVPYDNAYGPDPYAEYYQ